MSKQIKLKGKDIFDGYRLLGENKVLVLTGDGTVESILDKDLAGEDIREVAGILCPGFVNTHCHLELSHMAGKVPEKTGLPAFLTTVMEHRTPPSPEAMAQAMAAAEAAMWQSGIAAVGDIANTTATLDIKQQGRLFYHSFIETMGFVEAAAANRFAHSKEVYQQFNAINGTMHHTSIVPHAPYSVSKALFELLASVHPNTPVSIHNQECRAENELYIDKTGAFVDFYRHFGILINGFAPSGHTSLQTYLPYMQPGKLLLVHNTFTTEQDILFAQAQHPDVYWCFCPQANLYIEQTLPDISCFRRHHCNITLGTDSLASNHQLSIWAEIQTIQQHFPDIPLEELLQWATLNGAHALNIVDTYGSFEKGKKPGVVALHHLHSERII
ncbi:amidohydrolase family protein [Chitinophaga defluvii]|uniref:Amidohydrolase family protein n=1 Tax=Chitinophaga defluvii TaxID=3163343 RepID=A0ABV2T9B9_9BACT